MANVINEGDILQEGKKVVNVSEDTFFQLVVSEIRRNGEVVRTEVEILPKFPKLARVLNLNPSKDLSNEFISTQGEMQRRA